MAKQWYGYKMGELGWERMKQFNSLQEYYEYVRTHKSGTTMCASQPLDTRGMAASEKCFKQQSSQQ